MALNQKCLRLISGIRKAKVAEIGIAQAECAVKILELPNVLKYYVIDPWFRLERTPVDDSENGYPDRKMGQHETQEQWEKIYNNAKDRIEQSGKDHQILRMFSHEAAAQIDEKLDVIYIHGKHQYKSMTNDLEAWYPMLKDGGVLICDNHKLHGGEVIDGKYGGPEASKVDRAVYDFCRNNNLDFYLLDDACVITKAPRHLLELKDKHKGERVFIIGNGPSLNKTDLNLIKGEHSIAMNRISLIYPRTEWRPDYYIYFSDNIHNPKWGKDWLGSVNDAIKEPFTTPILWEIFRDEVEQNGKTVWIRNVSEEGIGHPKTFSTDISQWLSKTGTSMNIAFQLAYYMGFEQVFVLGADLNWVTSNSSQGDPNHFDQSYQANIPNGEIERDRMRTTHQRVAENFRAANKQIYNATIDTLVDCYPLVSFENVAKNKTWKGFGTDEDSSKIKELRTKISKYWEQREEFLKNINNS